MFILELTLRSWNHSEENKRRTLQRNDIAAAITRTDIFDFLARAPPGPSPGAVPSAVPAVLPQCSAAQLPTTHTGRAVHYRHVSRAWVHHGAPCDCTRLLFRPQWAASGGAARAARPLASAAHVLQPKG